MGKRKPREAPRAAFASVERFLEQAGVRVPLALFAATRFAAVLDYANSDLVQQRLLVLDSARYYEAAGHIAARDFTNGSSVFAFPPLYAYLLALLRALGFDLPLVYLVQVAISALNTWLLYRLGSAIVSRAAGTLAACLWVLYGAAGMLEFKIMETTLGVCLSLSSLLLLLRARERGVRSAGLAGLALGACCLTRPNTLLFAPLAAAWLVTAGTWRRLSRRNLGAVAAFVFGVVLAIAPVTLRNRFVSGDWVLISSQGGVTFYQGNNPSADGSYSTVAELSGDPLRQAAEAHDAARAALGREPTPSEVDGYWYERGFEYLRSEPASTAMLGLRKLRRWLGSDELSMEYVLAAERSLHPSLWLMPLPFALLLATATLGMRRRLLVGEPALVVGFVAINLLTALVFFFASRYRAPAVPCICLLSAHGLLELGRGVRPFRLVTAAAMAAFSWYSPSPAYELQQASYFYMLGNEYFKSGEQLTAIAFFERAAEGRPNDWAIRHNLGEAYGVIGRYEAAVEQLSAAEKLDPRRESTQRALAYYSERLRAR